MACAGPKTFAATTTSGSPPGHVHPAVSAPEDIDALITQLSHFAESVHEIEEDEEPEEPTTEAIELRQLAQRGPRR